MLASNAQDPFLCFERRNRAGKTLHGLIRVGRQLRGSRHGKSKVDEVERLRSEISELRGVIATQSRQPSRPGVLGAIGSSSAPNANASRSPLFSNDTSNIPRKPENKKGSVVKHLGRLVAVHPGQDFFAGSTTGVHFVRSVEQKWQHMFDSSYSFPDQFFRMHLLIQPAMLCPSSDSLCVTTPNSTLAINGDFRLPGEYHLRRLQRYLSRWNNIFPVFCRSQATQTFSALPARIEANQTSNSDAPDRCCLFLVLAIDAWDARDLEHGEHALRYYKAAMNLEPEALEVLDLRTIQYRILKVLYLHLSGKHALIACEVGATVRAAQCIGLHRQSRRFKLSAGEAEHRTRLWWCVSILDM